MPNGNTITTPPPLSFAYVPFGSKRPRTRKAVPDIPEDAEMTAKPLPAKKGFLFGCDPELFIKDAKTGDYVSAEGLIPGTKESPHPVKFGAVQVDGMAAEFNIDPAPDFTEFNRNIQAVLNQLEKMLPKGLVLDAVPAVQFKPEIFDSAPDKAKMLGCSPDFNAWTGAVNPPPRDPENPYLRTASGHLHVGWTEDADMSDLQHIMNCQDLVKQFDWFLGGWSCKMDTDPTRRRLYGRAGACRYKTYGVEYRVLSNFWITTRERRLAVWNRMQAAINSMAKCFYPDVVGGYNGLLTEGINETKLHRQLLSDYAQPLIKLDVAKYA
jgi:hypothetical protein